MANSILPSGEELHVTPDEILRYLNPDGLRQLLRHERIRWSLKVNKDLDYYDPEHLFRYTSKLHNEGYYQRMEIRTFPDNDAIPGYAGVHVDSGIFGIVHNWDKWSEAISPDSLKTTASRLMLGATAVMYNKRGYGLDNEGKMTNDTSNRTAAMIFDPVDGRIYALTNDDPMYVNNESRSATTRLPSRTVARIGDIPTRTTQLLNDMDYISDSSYIHTDNNFTNSNRFIVDNLDDRTFVYPEISKDSAGKYVSNIRIGLSGKPGYGESDGEYQKNTQPDINKSRESEDINSYNTNFDFGGLSHEEGFLPGVFRSLEELNKVDLVGQRMSPASHDVTPSAKRPNMWYLLDGRWSSNWSTNHAIYKESYLAEPLNPNNMEIYIEGKEPVPYGGLAEFDRSELYQWRYNRIELRYPSEDIEINIVESGREYEEGDILRWSFGDDSFVYRVTKIGPNGQIQAGEYIPSENSDYKQDPSTHGLGIEFTNTTSVGRGAKLEITARAKMVAYATQIKNNLYAYVDVTPTVPSDNSSDWSDVSMPDPQGGLIGVRSTAAGPAYSGINSGRGGPEPSSYVSTSTLYEHGGNATAGVHVHLFRYVINTQQPAWVIENGVQVFTGSWVDQGPMGLERPCDIKALLFSNPDTNNFNNYYKFMLDLFFDSITRNPDGVITNNPNSVSTAYFHIDQVDPDPERKFTQKWINPVTSLVEEIDITSRVIYINVATGTLFVYNSSIKNDPTFGYGYRNVGWVPMAGAITK